MFLLQRRTWGSFAWIGIVKLITASTVAGLQLKRCSSTQYVAAALDLYSSACRDFVMADPEVRMSLLTVRCFFMRCS